MQYLKFNKWWVYKIGSGVFTFCLFKFLHCGNLHSDCLTFKDLILFFVLILLAIFGHFINDWSDYDSDNRVGKSNIFQTINVTAAIPLILMLGIGIFTISFYYLPLIALPFVILQIACCILYSAQPFRLKEKGIASLFLTGIYERSLPYMIILLSMGAFSNEMACLAVIYLCWSYLWECRNFINGQVADFEEDIKSGTKSIAVISGLENTSRLKDRLTFFELIALVAWMAFLLLFVEKSWIFIALSIFVVLLHWSLNKGAKLLKSQAFFLDYLYNHAFLAGLMISFLLAGKTHWFGAVLVLFLFRSAYAKFTFLVICNVFRWIGVKMYYGVRLVVSKLVNYAIYYFRKYVLHWSDAKSRGDKKA